MTQLSEVESKRIDFERVTAIYKKGKIDDDKPEKGKKTPATRASARRRQVADEDEADEGDADEDEDEEGAGADEDDEDEDLFDSDEEREISERNKSKAAAPKKSKAKAAAATTAVTKKKPKSRLDELDDEDEDYEGSDGDEAEEGEEDDQAGDSRKAFAFKETEKDESGPATLEDFHKIIVKRDMLKNSINEPFFKEAVVGQFVRYCVGRTEVRDAAGQPVKDDSGEIKTRDVYRMMEIIDVVEKETLDKFPTGTPHEAVVSTHKRLRLQFGSDEHDVRMSKLSNHRVTDREFFAWHKESKSVRNFKELTKNQVQRRADVRKKLTKEHKYTKEEIDAMIATSNKAGFVSGKVKFSGLTFEEAQRNLLAAKEAVGDDQAAQVAIDKDLQQLERKKAQLDAAYLEQSRRQRFINEAKLRENLRKDAEASRKVEQLLKEASRGDAAKRIDPFVRRETLSRNLWIEGMKGKSQDSAAATAAATAAAEQEKATAAAKKEADAKAAAVAFGLSGRVAFDSELARAIGYMDSERVHSRVLEKLRTLIRPDFPDPLEVAALSQHERYVQTLHQKFPELGEVPKADAAARALFRKSVFPTGGISIGEWLVQSSDN